MVAEPLCEPVKLVVCEFAVLHNGFAEGQNLPWVVIAHILTDRSRLEENEKALCGDPRHSEKCAGCYSQHYKRAEIVIVRLAAQWSAFLHSGKLLIRAAFNLAATRLAAPY